MGSDASSPPSGQRIPLSVQLHSFADSLLSQVVSDHPGVCVEELALGLARRTVCQSVVSQGLMSSLS